MHLPPLVPWQPSLANPVSSPGRPVRPHQHGGTVRPWLPASLPRQLLARHVPTSLPRLPPLPPLVIASRLSGTVPLGLDSGVSPSSVIASPSRRPRSSPAPPPVVSCGCDYILSFSIYFYVLVSSLLDDYPRSYGSVFPFYLSVERLLSTLIRSSWFVFDIPRVRIRIRVRLVRF